MPKIKDVLVQNMFAPGFFKKESFLGGHFTVRSEKSTYYSLPCTVIFHIPQEERKTTITESDFIEAWDSLVPAGLTVSKNAVLGKLFGPSRPEDNAETSSAATAKSDGPRDNSSFSTKGSPSDPEAI